MALSRSFHFLVAIVVAVHVISSLGNVTPTPQMGWNSWNKFACNISEDLIKETVDAIISTGLSDLGYEYINLDDCWQASSRDINGNVQADPIRFPSGMKSLGEYIHSKGLKFGLYSSAGFKTCQGYPASLGMEEIDAELYNSWNVDYLKYDNCYTDHASPQKRFQPMAEALKSTNKELFFSFCEWGRENPAVWASDMFASSWRISEDIFDSWDSIISNANTGASLWRYAGVNKGWNDPDMLEVGNGKCSDIEYKSHFSLWAVMKAPLIIGNDVREMLANTSSVTMEILTNKEVIAVNQDVLGLQARRIWSDNPKNSVGKLVATKCSSGNALYEDAAIDQQWYVQANGTIMSMSTGRCLQESDRYETNPTIGVGRVVLPSDCMSATKWSLGGYTGGAIVSEATGLCLEVSKLEFYAETQGKFVRTATCQSIPFIDKEQFVDIREHQSWTYPNGKLLNLYQRQCLTVDQDAYEGTEEVWVSPLQDQSYAVLLLNKGKALSTMSLSYDMLVKMSPLLFSSDAVTFKMRDLWLHQDLSDTLSQSGSASFPVDAHGVVMLKLSPV